MKAARVLVVDDSLFMRKLISRFISEDPALVVAGTAGNGEEAIRLAEELRPDVITLDIEMPVMNGLEALTRLMSKNPVPVLMLSSLTQEGAAATIKALELGAVDFIGKPSGSTSADLFKVKAELLSKIKAASRTPRSALRPKVTESNPAFRRYGNLPPVNPVKESIPRSKVFHQIVAIGTSTGGPRALGEVLRQLPGDLPFPIVVVQHMPPKFTASLAQRLDQQCGVHVVEASEDELLRAGTVYIAPGDSHLTVIEKNGEFRIKLNQDNLRNGHRPSVDVLYESMVKLPRLKKHYVIMTGMGSDGAKGMLLAKEAGSASTIAESADSCVVFGMPRAAIALNCIDHIVPVDQIAAKLMEMTRK